jgi:hypothetical protein
MFGFVDAEVRIKDPDLFSDFFKTSSRTSSFLKSEACVRTNC